MLQILGVVISAGVVASRSRWIYLLDSPKMGIKPYVMGTSDPRLINS